MIVDFLARQNEALSRLNGRSWPFRWLWAPSGNAVEFALRNTIASLFALGIAFWMELGEPQWAAMTVWITAQGSRGESLSKGRWRLVGTLLGVIAAITLVSGFPQAPWLFIPVLALWAGLCTGLATLLHNFRAYAFVLAAYTCAIIATGSLSAPDHVFEIAMARGTYIVLGVLCEMAAGLIFSASLAVKARRTMRAWLIEGIEGASHVISDVLAGAAPPEAAIRAVFSRTLKLNEQLEFTVVEVGRSDHAIACAYATIGILSKIVSRGLGMQARLSITPVVSEMTRKMQAEVAAFIRGLTARLGDAALVVSLREDLRVLQARLDILYRQADNGGGESFTPDDRIILHGIRLILEEYETLLVYFEAKPDEALTPARFRLRRVMHFHAAFHNAMRSTAAILLAGLFWEVTAWSQGAAFISFIAVVVAGFATTDNTVLVSNRFFYGACFAALASIVPVFFLIPLGSGFEALVVAVGPLMFIGGLAIRNPATATAGSAYNTFLPAIIGLDNQTRMSELGWFNATMALLLGLGAGVLVFRCILPFNMHQVCVLLRRRALKGLVRICTSRRRLPEENRWIGLVTQGMERVIRYAGTGLTPFIELNLHGLLSVMTLGRNLLFLRGFASRPTLPPALADILTDFFREIGPHWLRMPSTEESAFSVRLETAIATLREQACSASESERLAYAEALGSFIVVQHEWAGNQLWLDNRSFRSALQKASNQDA
ncbi:FUSC family protein [Asaia prunellae]|uniref:FUSC family protein n=1 Tax=Asaia prunellae TaxID=610245 RepID=UPI00046F7AAC|nr:FUSC family protein [Asaia prunellae]